MLQTVCPAGGKEVPPPFNDEQNFLTDAPTLAADSALSDLDNYGEHFKWFEDTARAYYEATGMQEAFPERADMLVARKVHNVGQVVLKALADEELMRRTLMLREPHELLLPYSISAPLYLEGTGHLQGGEYDRFLQTMTAQYMGATAAFLCRTEAEDTHQGFWETIDEQESAYHATWRNYRQAAEQRGVQRLNPPFEPFGNASDAATGGIGNNMLTVQSLLLAHQSLYDGRWDPQSGEPYNSFMRRTALEQAALLALPASTKRGITADILPDPATTETEAGDVVCEDPLRHAARQDGLVTGKDGKDYWRHSSLRNNKPWRVRGSCVGDVPHLPTPDGEAVVDEFFEWISSYANGMAVGRDENGRFNSVLVAHSIGALVAELTMYKNKMK